jgi:hypothetical protein
MVLCEIRVDSQTLSCSIFELRAASRQFKGQFHETF